MNVEPTKILIVEDNPNELKLIKLALEEYNFVNPIASVTDGEEALEYLHGKDGTETTFPLPELVLLDLKLPKISGIEVLEAIRNHPRTKNLVVVVMTSSSEDRDLEACYQLNVNSYIVKPLDFEQLLKVAQTVGYYWIMLNQLPPSISRRSV